MTTRTKIRTVAIIASLAYTAVRVVLVQVSLSSYGINPWLFLIIDGVTGVVYVLCIEQLILAFAAKHERSWKPILGWSLLIAAAFAVPYLYIFMFSKELPPSFAAGIGLIVVVLLVNAVFSLVRRMRGSRAR